MSFIEFETVKGEIICINPNKIIAATPIRSPDDDGVIVMYGEREDCCSVVKGKLNEVVSKIEHFLNGEDAS